MNAARLGSEAITTSRLLQMIVIYLSCYNYLLKSITLIQDNG